MKERLIQASFLRRHRRRRGPLALAEIAGVNGQREKNIGNFPRSQREAALFDWQLISGNSKAKTNHTNERSYYQIWRLFLKNKSWIWKQSCMNPYALNAVPFVLLSHWALRARNESFLPNGQKTDDFFNQKWLFKWMFFQAGSAADT